MNAIALYRISRWLFLRRVPVLPSLLKGLTFLLFNSVVPYTCRIGERTKCGYGGIGVVLHARCVIGSNVMIGPQVTVGGRSNREGVPQIGNNVFLATGAKVLGDITIGDNVVVGANAVVIESVPSNSIVAGVPARVIRSNIKVADHCNLPDIEREKVQ